MTDNEAKVFIQNAMIQSKNVLAELLLIAPKVFAAKKKSLGEYYSNLENCKKEIESCEGAIRALEEVDRKSTRLKLSHARWRYGHWKRCSAGTHQ